MNFHRAGIKLATSGSAVGRATDCAMKPGTSMVEQIEIETQIECIIVYYNPSHAE